MTIPAQTLRFTGLHASYKNDDGEQTLRIVADGADKETHGELLRGGDSLTINFNPESKTGEFLSLPERNPNGIRSPRTFRYLWNLLSQVPNTTMLKDFWHLDGSYRKMEPNDADLPLSLVKEAFIKQLQKDFRESCKTTDIYVSALLDALKTGQTESLRQKVAEADQA